MSCRLVIPRDRPLNKQARQQERVGSVERLTHRPGLDPAYVDGWNDALDAVKR
jgi:hypothetical protein